MTTAALELRYLFGARFADGSELFQGPEDQSRVDPNRSAFFDLCEKGADDGLALDSDGVAIPRGDIDLFELRGEHAYLVDLRDGHFEVDGTPFSMEIPPPGTKLRLIYFRRRRHHIAVGPLGAVEELAQECEYHVGWKAEWDGEQHKHVLIVG